MPGTGPIKLNRRATIITVGKFPELEVYSASTLFLRAISEYNIGMESEVTIKMAI